MQLRIKIECAFGQLVNRWGILRRAISARTGLYKATRLVTCLCRLHNFCINRRLLKTKNSEQSTASENKNKNEQQEDDDLARPLAIDDAEIAVNGGIRREQRPNQLLDGGEHFDEYNSASRKLLWRMEQQPNLPRERLHQEVVDKCLRRPTPKQWQKSTAK